MLQQKTYWHLLEQKRIPSEYEISSSRLHYYKTLGTFEIDAPIKQWYDRYQLGSPLVCRDWERFYDPRQTTYTSYAALQSTREIFVDGLFELIDNSDYDSTISPSWLEILELVVAPLRYPIHGLQMIAAYVGQMAPDSRITIAAMFQCADEVRRIQRIAYRIRQLQMPYPQFANNSKDLWQTDPLWQPMRAVLERMLVTYDWGESFVCMNMVFKPLFDELFLVVLAKLAKQRGDHLLEVIFSSFYLDCLWHRQWSRTLITTATEQNPDNKTVIEQWITQWHPMALNALHPVAALVDRISAADNSDGDQVVHNSAVQWLHEFYRNYLNSCTLTLPRSCSSSANMQSAKTSGGK